MELELNKRLILVDLQFRLGHRIVDSVMDIKLAAVLVAHPAAADVGFVRQNQRRRHGTDRRTCPLVVVANGSDHLGNVQGVHMQMVQQAEGHHRPALRMVDAVDQVANVVEVGRDLDQLHLPGGVPQRL